MLMETVKPREISLKYITPSNVWEYWKFLCFACVLKSSVALGLTACTFMFMSQNPQTEDVGCSLKRNQLESAQDGTGHGRAVWLLWLWGWVLLCGPALLMCSLCVQSKSFCPCLRIHFWCQNAFCALRFARVGQWLVAPLVRDAESKVHGINHPPLSSLWQADLSFSASVSHPGQWGKHRAGPALHEHPTHNNTHQGNKAMWVMNSALPHHSLPRIILSSFACLQTEYFVWFSLVLLFLVWVFWWTGFGSGLPFTASACSIGECFPQTGFLEVFLSLWQLGIDVYMS